MLFSRAGMLSLSNDLPQTACRPFDRDRDGMVPAEGGAVLILESERYAIKRDARIYAELAAAVMTGDAYNLTAPSPEATEAAYAMRMALEKAGVDPEDLDYISAHGTSTPLNDLMETRAIKKAFGPCAYDIPVSAVKSMLGHTLGASSVIELVCAIVAMKNEFIPPTINLENPDVECDLDYVPKHARAGHLKNVLVNNSGFGGKNVAMVLKNVEGRP